FIQIQAARRELGDRIAGSGLDFNIEYLGSNHATNRALVHGKETSANPVPSLIVMAGIDANPNFHFRLAPETRIVGPSQPGARIEIGALIFAIGANDFDPWLVIWIFPKIIVRQQFEADLFRSRHLVFRTERHPLAAGGNSILLPLIRAHRALLSKGRSGRQHQTRSHRSQTKTPLTSKRVQYFQGFPPTREHPYILNPENAQELHEGSSRLKNGQRKDEAFVLICISSGY